MASYDFDFQRYVDRQKTRHGVETGEGAEGFGDYAFSGDLRVLRRLDRMKPVRVVAEATVRFWRSVQRNELLGQSVKVTRRQFPEIYDTTVECAQTLDIAMPTVYVSRAFGLNAGTYGTNEEAFVIVGTPLMEVLEPEELKYVIGHECGHMQNNHVVYRTAVAFLTQGMGIYVKWASGAGVDGARRLEHGAARSPAIEPGSSAAGTRSQRLNAMMKLASRQPQARSRRSTWTSYLAPARRDQRWGSGASAELFRLAPVRAQARAGAEACSPESSLLPVADWGEGGEALDEVDQSGRGARTRFCERSRGGTPMPTLRRREALGAAASSNDKRARFW